uniref:Haloacid dehalogenase n=1 Tax=uncultured Muribaculaceae bacterium TaxID=2301481 RepID=A0A6G8F3H7_9BACT|nr:haloacid dehalogenase [uncultured Muribaculaceae bacterium]
MKDIKNIIFDLGGVVIDLDREQAVIALSNLGIPDADILLGQYEQKGPFLLLESGRVSTSEFFDGILPYCRPGTTCTEIQDAFERFLIGLPTERLVAIRHLRKRGFKLYVLSNTNPVMFNHWIDLAFRQEGLSINDYFDGIVTSYQERTCKPDQRIFSALLSRYGLKPEETLLLDDSAANCNSAATLGVNTICITKTGETSFAEVCKHLEEEGPAK